MSLSATAKKMGGKKGLLLNSSELKFWDSISIYVQYEICKYKIENYSEVRNDLIKSGNKKLIHPALRCSQEKLENRIWEGKAIIVDGEVGKNTLGNIWIDLRSLYIC